MKTFACAKNETSIQNSHIDKSLKLLKFKQNQQNINEKLLNKVQIQARDQQVSTRTENHQKTYTDQ